MGRPLLRDLERPNTLPPSLPEIIKEADGISDEAYGALESVNYGVIPWIFDDERVWFAPIPEQVVILANEERVPWTDDPRMPR